MRLYETPSGLIVGTQAEAKAAGKGWQQVEVPTDKAGLIKHLNRERECVIAAQSEVVAVEGTPAATVPLPDLEADARAYAADRLTDVEEFIQAADAGTLARLADNVCWRLKELLKGITK